MKIFVESDKDRGTARIELVWICTEERWWAQRTVDVEELPGRKKRGRPKVHRCSEVTPIITIRQNVDPQPIYQQV